MKTPRLQLLALPVGLTALAAIPAQGQSADALIDKLIDKGILTVDEAKELRDEAGKGFDSAYQIKSGLPDWVTSLRVGGDLRARYDMISADHPEFTDRHRFRYRVRPGIWATLWDNFEVGFRLTSGEPVGNFGGDPISGNSTFQNNASKKFAYIDLAYASWTAVENSMWSSTLTIGKMENPWVFSDLVFDSDYTPEGFAQQFAFNLNEQHKLALNLGEFSLDELSGSSRDPWLLGGQFRLESKWTGQVATSFGIGALLITAEESLSEPPGGTPAVPNVNTGNTRSAGVLTEDYNPIIADGAFTYTLDDFWGYSAKFPIRLTAEYLNNPGADDENEGYSFGVTFGKSGKKGLWDVGYRWKHLESDAWYEEMVDSDTAALFPGVTARAGTNIEGHVFRARYSPYDSLTIGVTYFLMERITGVTRELDEELNRVLVDAMWKF